MIVRFENGIWEAVQVSRDHAPDEPDEARRIISHKGRIFAKNGDGPPRVWLAKEDRPGLAMTRSLGDRA